MATRVESKPLDAVNPAISPDIKPITKAEEKVEKLIKRGFAITGEVTRIIDGQQVKEITLEKNKSGTGERIARGAAGLAATVATLPALGAINLDKDVREETWIPAIKGSVKKVLYVDTGKAEDIDPERIGCDIRSPKAVREMLEAKRSEWCESNGHYFVEGKGRRGVSFFYFIPEGDVNKAEVINYFKTKNYMPITNRQKQLRAIRSYCAAYDDIQTKWEKKIPELATSLVELRKDKENPIDQKDAVKALKNQPLTIVIDARLGAARVYAPFDRNKVKLDDHRTGTALDLDKDTIEEINKVHGKSMKYKEPLEGRQPFKKPPSNPLEELMKSKSKGDQHIDVQEDSDIEGGSDEVIGSETSSD